MNRLEKKLADLKRSGKKALSVFLTAGYPSLRATEELVPALESCGVDFFEIGFPFSDPIADGPVIQRSSEEALRRGATWSGLLRLARRARRRSQAPLILMSYANPLYARGWRRAARELAAAGFDGVILPDLIPEEDRGLGKTFREAGLSLVYLAAPTSSDSRIRRIARASSGFVYCVSVTGVTGARRDLPAREVSAFLKRVRRLSSLPVVLGFGISNPRQLRQLAAADGFIVGSALVRALDGGAGLPALIRRAKNFIIPFARETS